MTTRKMETSLSEEISFDKCVSVYGFITVPELKFDPPVPQNVTLLENRGLFFLHK